VTAPPMAYLEGNDEEGEEKCGPIEGAHRAHVRLQHAELREGVDGAGLAVDAVVAPLGDPAACVRKLPVA
jgi:hypothetical protein